MFVGDFELKSICNYMDGLGGYIHFNKIQDNTLEIYLKSFDKYVFLELSKSNAEIRKHNECIGWVFLISQVEEDKKSELNYFLNYLINSMIFINDKD